MNRIDTKGLLLRILIPTAAFSFAWLVLGHFCTIPNLLLFCILASVILVPAELGIILCAGKKENGTYSTDAVMLRGRIMVMKTALAGQERLPVWKILVPAFVFFGIAGLLSAFIAPVENQIFSEMRAGVLNLLPAGFDWTDYGYLKSFSRPVLILTCVYYGIFNVLLGPVTEELFFRGYLTSHYEKQSSFTPILITVLFSLYHFWLPFHNIFRILAFAPAAYFSYKKKNLYISMCFHCMCNLFATIGFIIEVLC